MPFLPSSPTRIFSRNKARTGTKPTDATRSDRLHFEHNTMHLAKPSSTSPRAQDAADPNTETLPSGDSKRGSVSSWGGATVGTLHKHSGSFQAINDGARQTKLENSEATNTTEVDSDHQTTTDAKFVGDQLDEPTNSARRSRALSENKSESEYSREDDIQPVVGRTSSVKVGRPLIVQHKASIKAKPYQGTATHTRSDSHASFKAERIGHRPEALPSTPEEGTSRCSTDIPPRSPVSVKDFQAIVQSSSRLSSDISSVRHQSIGTKERAIVMPLSDEGSSGLPTGNTLHSIHPTIVGSETPTEPTPGINRTMSSPLPLPGKGLSRRVTIRPSDLITNHAQTNFFRETVVTTPYPPRVSSDTDDHSSRHSSEKAEHVSNLQNQQCAAKDKQKRKVSFSKTPGEKDRFPSPERPEVLFLNLALHRHPCAVSTLEIQITDKGSFDDEMLFIQLRGAYSKQLLGMPRLLFTACRRVGFSSITSPRNYEASDFNYSDFLRHFRDPRIGRKRKAWVIWLRNNNPRSAAPTSIQMPTHPDSSGIVRQLDTLNRLSLRTRGMGHSRRSSWNKSRHTDRDVITEDKKRQSTASDASSFHFVYSPAIPRMPFLKNQQNGNEVDSPIAVNSGSPARSFFWPSNLSPSSSSQSRHTEGNEARIVTISFHHEYRIAVMALMTFCLLAWSVLMAVVWVVFGVPGARPGTDGSYRVGDHNHYSLPRTDWRVDAQARVVTGVVIGLVFLVLGSIIEAGVIWGGYLLL